MTGKEIVKLYINSGWVIDRIHGSHYVMKKGTAIEIIPVHSNKDLPTGLCSKLLKRLR